MGPSVQFLNVNSVDERLLSQLSSMAFSSSGTRRICLHKSESAHLHAMLVESVSGRRYPAHRHCDGDEVALVIRGALQVTLWNNGPNEPPITITMGDRVGDSKVVFIPKNSIHATEALNGNCIYFEVKLGPFSAEACQYPDPKSLIGYANAEF